MNILINFIIIIFAIGCSSSKIKELDTELQYKGNSSLGQIGIKEDKVIIQKEVFADIELRQLQWDASGSLKPYHL